MAYIKDGDYPAYIRSEKLNQILSPDNPTAREEAELTAIQIVRDALHTRYDTDAIFAKVDAARDKQVVRWVICITLYFLYERIPDLMVPDRVVKNYDDVMATLLSIEDGKASVQLPRLLNEDDRPKTKFRWGSQTQRDHDV